MVSLFYVNKFLAALATDQEIPTGAQLPWIPDEISKAELLISSFERHEEVLLYCMRLHAEASVQWHKYAGRFNPLAR